MASRIPGDGIGRGDHRLASDLVEKRPEKQRAEYIAGREGKDIKPDALMRDMIERRQHESVGEEDRIIEEALRAHQREADQCTRTEGHKERAKDLNERRMVSRLDAQRLQTIGIAQRDLAVGEFGLDLPGDRLGLFLVSMNHEPARTSRE